MQKRRGAANEPMISPTQAPLAMESARAGRKTTVNATKQNALPSSDLMEKNTTKTSGIKGA